MGKVLKIALVVGAVALAFVPGAQGVLAGVLSGVGIGGGVTAFGFAAASVIAGIVIPLGLTSALGMAAKALGLGPKLPTASAATVTRLRASVEPATSRKLWFGRTAGNTDIRYAEYTGSNQEYMWQVVALASHKVSAINELWLDDKLAWDSTGGVTGDFAGYLDVYAVTEGSHANVTNISATWSAAAQRYLTGIAHLDLRFKRTGNSKQAESPFASSITNRLTIRGEGMPVYDPRRDSTVPGGSGSHRSNNQSTWQFAVSGDEIGRNPALILLAFLLGWRINGKLAVGRGVPVSRLSIASFMTAANLCDEPVTLAGGGTEPRYRFDGVFGEGDDGGTVLETLKTSMHALLRDAGGQIALDVVHNDLSVPAWTLTDDDFLGPFEWEQTQSLAEDRNIVRGRHVDPSDEALYQLVDFPQVRIDSVDGIDRIASLDLPGVQSSSQAQRLAKQYLQRLKYQGTLHSEVNLKGWGMLIGKPGKVTLAALGFVDKWFRLVERPIDPTSGRVGVVLQEEATAIYAWDAEEAPAVTAAPPIVYDWRNNPMITPVPDDADNTAGALAGGALDLTTPVTGGTTLGDLANGGGGAAPPVVLTGQVGTFGPILVTLEAGASASFEAQVRVENLLGACAQSVKLKGRPVGGAYSDFTINGTDSGNLGDDITAYQSGSFTNVTGAKAVFEIAAEASKTGSTGTIDQSQSFLRLT